MLHEKTLEIFPEAGLERYLIVLKCLCNLPSYQPRGLPCSKVSLLGSERKYQGKSDVVMLSWAVAVMMRIISGFFLFSRLIVKVRIVVHSMD